MKLIYRENCFSEIDFIKSYNLKGKNIKVKLLRKLLKKLVNLGDVQKVVESSREIASHWGKSCFNNISLWYYIYQLIHQINRW